LLQELGYGLDLKECVATGSSDDLIYVSPKSAAAVSRGAGEPYKDKLLKLPGFLTPLRYETTPDEADEQLLERLKLSGYFIHKNLLTHYSKESLPARERFINSLQKQIQNKS
jgi:DNA repair protein RecO (recombination protein O)